MTWISNLLDKFGPVSPLMNDKINVLTVAGTGAINPRTGTANFPAQVAQLLDPDLFNWVPITYPAAMPLGWSVNAGTLMLAAALRTRPGRFVGLGFSQGSMVWSRIRPMITAVSGPLHSRNTDWLGTVVMGNPCRYTNATFPGYSVTSGHHGIADAAHRLGAGDSRWWEMVIPDDLAADIGDDLTGQWLTVMFMAAWDGTNPAAAITATLRAAPVDLTNLLPEFLSYFGLGQVDGAAHTQYDTYIPATISGEANSKTMVQLAADRITSLAT